MKNKIKIFVKDIKNLIFYKTAESYQSAVFIIILAAVLLISYNTATFISAYRNVNAAAHKKAGIISGLGELAMQEPLWNLDDDVISKIANSLFYDKEVSAVKITSLTGTVMFEKDNSALESGKDKYLVYSTQDIVKKGMIETGYMVEGQKLGTINVGITKYYQQRHIIKVFITSVIINLITLFLIYLAVIAILNQEKTNRKRINSILDNMVDSVITTNKELVIKSCNLATEKMFGFTAAEVVGASLCQLLSSENVEEITADTLKFYSTHLTLNFNGIKKNSQTFPVEFSVGSIIIEGEQVLVIVIRDITIRKEVEKAKNEFISTISHELRTPLTAIKGALALLKSGALGQFTTQVLSLLTVADNNSSRLINLINGILDMDRIESGKMTLAITENNIVSIIKEAVESNLTYADQFNIGLIFISDVENLSVLADRQKIIQVLSNLISNAIKFSPPHEIVKISVEKLDKTVRVSVKDKGIGISEEHRSKLFQKFVQIDSSDTRKVGGTGLGLSICKAIVEQHNGFISFDSEPNDGSLFFFDLPLYTSSVLSETPVD